jgi:tetratricopeptide (TPR) repeat protein
MYREAIAEYQLSIPLSGDSPDEYAALAYAYALSGRRADALRIIEDLKRRSERMYIPPSLIAFIYAGLGEKDKAFEWMEKAYVGRDFLMSVLNVEPLFDQLRDDPRFDRLTSRVGLPKIENVVSPTQ